MSELPGDFTESVATDNPFKQHVPVNTHIEKIKLDFSRNELKLLLSERMKNDGTVNKPLNDLTDKCCHLFGFVDWLQAYHKL